MPEILFPGRGTAMRIPATSDSIAAIARPLRGGEEDLEPALDLVGDARIAMLGEATHGTAEFYALRARLTRRLIERKGFSFVAIEGDWPDASAINRWVRGGSGTALDALDGFRRFPAWMWRNTVVLPFVQWLRSHNESLGADQPKVGFYGLDLYSLHASMEAVVRFLERVDPALAREAKQRYSCFEPFGDDTQKYAFSSHFQQVSCEEDVVSILIEVMSNRSRFLERASAEDVLEAELNAIAVINSERYYRKMVGDGTVTWNMRDRHMAATLNRLLAEAGPRAKAVVWEHNSHIGDFRAILGQGGQVNVGQLIRQKYGSDAVAIGFGTYRGTVTAASRWDGPAEFKSVPPAREGSFEAVFHDVGLPSFFLATRGLDPSSAQGWLHDPHRERAIGVVYDPEHEAGNYLPSRLARRYDGYFFVDETLALEPLDPPFEPPGLESYPSGL